MIVVVALAFAAAAALVAATGVMLWAASEGCPVCRDLLGFNKE